MGLRAGVALLIALGLWVLGHQLAAVVLVTVFSVVSVAALLSPSVARALERAEGVIQRVAGNGLSFLLLGAIQLLVFTPLALVFRILGRNPLALGSSPRDASFWRPVPRRAGRPCTGARSHTNGDPDRPGAGRATACPSCACGRHSG